MAPFSQNSPVQIYFLFSSFSQVDLLGFLVQEQNQNTENSPSVKVNSLPELGKNQVDKSSRSAHISKSLPSVGLTKMSSENTGGEVASKAKQKRSRSPYVMEVVSDEGTATPAYSDDFTDVSSIDDDDERKTKSPEEVEREINLKARVEDSISDVKKARQKLNSPQQKVLTSAISTLEGLVKQLKDDIQNTKSHENAEDNTEEKDLQNKLLKGKRHDSLVTEENQENLIEILEEKEVIIDDLTSKIQESAAVIEERNQIVEKLLNRLLVSETSPIYFIHLDFFPIESNPEKGTFPGYITFCLFLLFFFFCILREIHHSHYIHDFTSKLLTTLYRSTHNKN